MEGKSRPLGVTIIAILLLLNALFYLAIGATALFLEEELEDLAMIVGAVMLIIGLVYLLLSIGSFKGWGWVWTLTMVWVILSIVISIGSWILNGAEMGELLSTLIGMILPVLILLYITKQNVKAFFGKA